MAGLVPAISLRRAPCLTKRGHRDKPGDDNFDSDFASSAPHHTSKNYVDALPRART